MASVVSKMGDKEKMGLGANTLKNVEVLKHLKGSDFEAIKKNEDDFTEVERDEIATKRMDALLDAVVKSEDSVVEHMVKNMNGKDLTALDNKSRATLQMPTIVKHLTSSQLKSMDEEGLDGNVKKTIGRMISNYAWGGGATHKAAGYVLSHAQTWQ